MAKIVRFSMFVAIGVITATAGINYAHWQLYAILTATAIACECAKHE